MSLQGLRQASVRGATSTTYSYNADWIALFRADAIDTGSFNGDMLAWINAYLGTSYTSLPQAQQAFAADQGAHNWSSMGTFSPAP